jgi:agmatine/peptidylarginine deiminase
MQKISLKAIENFKKALAEGKTQKKSNIQLRNSTVLEYTDLPFDARVPGQFEENQAIAMTWQYTFNPDFSLSDIPADPNVPNGRTACDLAEKIQQANAKVIIRVKAAVDSTTVKNIMIARGTPLTNYSFYVHPIDSFWDRDSAPISFYYGQQDNIGMIDMDYYTFAAIEDNMNNVSTDFAAINANGRINDDNIPIALGAKFGYPVYHTPLNDEGGNIISDGLGTFWGSDGTRKNNTTTIDLTDPTMTLFPNYPLTTQLQYNSLFLNSFKLNNNVEAQVFSCDGGTGHIDIYGKLIDENNFALADYTPAINHTDFNEWTANLQMFQGLLDSNSKPITIHLLPMPRIANGGIQTECELASPDFADQRTYVNGIFVNKSYIMPMQSDPSNPIPSDVAAITAFQQAMPGYTILPINVDWMFGTGGALHCITMQIPAENPVFIRHKAITGNVTLIPSIVIEAQIKNKSGLASQFVYYKKSTSSTWIALPMTPTFVGYYTASIPTAGFIAGDIIQYFIEATSNNGKTITKPFVAREGGYNKFTITGALGVGSFDNETNFTLGAYPNPTNGSFTLPISVDDNRKVSIEISDLLGRIVYSNKSELNKGLHLQEINLDKATGVYIIKTTIDNTISKTQKLVKK